MIPVYDILGRYPLLQSLDGDGNPVFVGTADKDDILIVHPQETHVNVGRDVHAGEVPDMDGPVCIGEGGGDGISLKNRFFAHGFWL